MSATEQGLKLKPQVKWKAKVVKLSLCPCGFHVLRDEIPVGAEYEVEAGVVTVGTMICGGCGKEHRVGLVMVKGRPGVKGGFLPRDIFGSFEVCP